VINTLATRAIQISDEELVEHELNHFSKVFKRNAYEDKQFEKAAAKARRGPCTRQLEEVHIAIYRTSKGQYTSLLRS
jgi:hypothetical protein